MAAKVLIADDEKDIRDLLVKFLVKNGFETRPVDSGMEALKAIRNDPSFDVLVLDNRMPGINGTEVIRELEKSEKRIPVIMLTGMAVPQEDYMKADATLRKPIDLNELMTKIKEVLRKQ